MSAQAVSSYCSRGTKPNTLLQLLSNDDKTAAIAVELSQRPSVALAAVVHAMTLSGFGLDLNLCRSKTCVQVSTLEAFLEGASGSPALSSLQQQKGAWLEILAAQPDIGAWCLQQDQPTLLKLLAHLVARTVKAVKSKSDTEDATARFAQADHLAAALDVADRTDGGQNGSAGRRRFRFVMRRGASDKLQ